MCRTQTAADRQGLRITTTLAPCTLTGSPDRLRQVMTNLLSNAVAYSPDGGDLDIRLTACDGAADVVIADHGLGIPEHERGRLFHRFHRGAEARERRIPGTGLGLAISRIIVERHNGTIRIAQNHPRGTVVTVHLSCDRP